jgi:hypothetical protein
VFPLKNVSGFERIGPKGTYTQFSQAAYSAQSDKFRAYKQTWKPTATTSFGSLSGADVEVAVLQVTRKSHPLQQKPTKWKRMVHILWILVGGLTWFLMLPSLGGKILSYQAPFSRAVSQIKACYLTVMAWVPALFFANQR